MKYIVKDSGKRIKYSSGFVRDIDDGKPRYDLIDHDMLKRWALLMMRGAKKYGERNWELANSEVEANRFKASAWRHFVQWSQGDQDEDHAAATIFNIAAYEKIIQKIRRRK